MVYKQIHHNIGYFPNMGSGDLNYSPHGFAKYTTEVKMEDTYSPTSEKSKVTLTNWVRLNNAPLLLPRASAVQWNDYIFVLASNGRALLYRNKHDMWSMLPKSPYSCFNLAPALTLHKGRILTMSPSGEVSTFDPQSCQWTTFNDLNMSKDVGPRIIASNNNILYSVVDFKTTVETQDGTYPIRRTVETQDGTYPIRRETDSSRHKICNIFSYNPSSKWEKICEIGSSPLKSAAVVEGTLFVHTGEKMFKLTLPRKPKLESNTKLQLPTTTDFDFSTQAVTGSLSGINTIPPQKVPRNQPVSHRASPAYAGSTLQSATACASPTYAGSTLHAIKDTLFSFGGRDKDNQPTSDVLRYNPDTDTWENAGYMRSVRYNVAVVTIQDTTMDVIVLGGSLGSSAHIMTERAVESDRGVPKSSHYSWDNKTSIVEKCAVN